MKRLGFAAAAVITFLLLLLLSYNIAGSHSDALFAGRPEEFYRIRSRLCLFRSITGHAGPSWEFVYDCRMLFSSDPVTVQMNFFGHPIASNPRDILSKLHKQP
jgi:hypothetical protein